MAWQAYKYDLDCSIKTSSSMKYNSSLNLVRTCFGFLSAPLYHWLEVFEFVAARWESVSHIRNNRSMQTSSCLFRYITPFVTRPL
jgi:hypothetical protein